MPTTVVLRATKGAPLSAAEHDLNITNLKTTADAAMAGVTGHTGQFSWVNAQENAVDNVPNGQIVMHHNTTTNGTYYIEPLRVEAYPTVQTGKVNSGFAIGSFSIVLRNSASSQVADGNGTLQAIYGSEVAYGHMADSGASPVTNAVVGMRLRRYFLSGSGTDWFDLKIENSPTPESLGATFTNLYSIFIDDNTNLGAVNKYALYIAGMGVIKSLDTTDTTDLNTGAAQFAGGLSVVKSAHIGGGITVDANAVIGGTLNVTGTPTFISQQAAFGSTTGTGFTAIFLQAAAGNTRAIQIRTGANARWSFGADSTAESGASAGSGWVLASVSDTGTVENVFTIVRASGGTMTFGGSSARLASFTGDVSVATGKGYKVNGVKVLGGQQTGLGTALAAYTLTGTYGTDLSNLQALYNKMVAVETIIRAHGFATT